MIERVCLWLLLGCCWLLYPFTGFCEGKKASVIATGERFIAEGDEFSIEPPFGWEIHSDYPQLSLLLQVPYEPKIDYQRTIQVMRFQEAKYIDEVTAREFEQVLVKQYGKVSESLRNYRIRNHLLIKLADGREALLFYSEFSLDEKPMMQAHVLLAAAKRSYLLTYTDLASHFEGQLSQIYLKPAWTAMTSFQVQGKTPVRFQGIYRAAAVLGFLLLFIGVALYLRRRRFHKVLAEEDKLAGHALVQSEQACDDVDDDDEDELYNSVNWRR